MDSKELDNLVDRLGDQLKELDGLVIRLDKQVKGLQTVNGIYSVFNVPLNEEFVDGFNAYQAQLFESALDLLACAKELGVAHWIRDDKCTMMYYQDTDDAHETTVAVRSIHKSGDAHPSLMFDIDGKELSLSFPINHIEVNPIKPYLTGDDYADMADNLHRWAGRLAALYCATQVFNTLHKILAEMAAGMRLRATKRMETKKEQSS